MEGNGYRGVPQRDIKVSTGCSHGSDKLMVYMKWSSSSRAHKPNTRFLKSLVRDVDGHNTALLREQANSARAAAADKFYQNTDPRSERDGGRQSRDSRSRTRNGEDVDVARMKRLFGGAVGLAAGSRRSDDRSRRDAEESSTRRQASRHLESHQSSSTSAVKSGGSGGAAGSWRREASGHSTSRYHSEDEASEDEEKGWSRKDVGRSKPRSAVERAREEEEARERRRARREEDQRKEKQRNRSPAPPAKRPFRDDVPGLRIPPPDITLAAPSIPSKMDRYFEPTYDPTKDYRAMLDAQDVAVPRTGLVPDVDIGWDSMLSTIKYRGQAKERGRDSDWKRETAEERDSNAREWERERERYASTKSRVKTSTSNSKRLRRDSGSPSIISIPVFSEVSSADNDSTSDSRSELSDAERKKRKHGSSSKRKKSSRSRDKEHRSKKDSSQKRSSKRRRHDSDEERDKKKILVGGYEYVSKGATREWDRGK